jgi:hypothetical protein
MNPQIYKISKYKKMSENYKSKIDNIGHRSPNPSTSRNVLPVESVLVQTLSTALLRSSYAELAHALLFNS